MRYWRCACGKRESWGSLAPPACQGCPDCGVTLAEYEGGHTTPAPHTFAPLWRIDPKSGRYWQERRCTVCGTTEPVPGTTGYALGAQGAPTGSEGPEA